MLTPGTLLQDRYVVERLLDRSAFGDLYLARDQRTRQPVDIKAVTRSAANIDIQFSHEAAAFAAARNAALPAVVDAFTTPLGRFLVADHVPGINLDELRARVPHGRLDADAALRLMQPVIEALDHLHGWTPPLLHRDVRPANIRVTTAGQVYLVNPGVAGGAVAPFAEGDPRTDLYAIGATLYTLLAGMSPPPATERLTRDTLPPLQQLRPDLPVALADIVRRLLALDGSRASASAATVQRDLFQAAPDQACKRCATMNRASARFCRKCGAELPAADPRGAIRAFVASLPQAPAPAVTAPAGVPIVAALRPPDAPTVTTPPLDAPTVTTPPLDAPTVTTPPLDAPTVTTPPLDAPTSHPVDAPAPPPIPPVAGQGGQTAPAVTPQRRRGLLIPGIIAAVILLAVCTGGYVALQSRGGLPGIVAVAVTPGGSVRPSPTAQTSSGGGSAATAEARQNATATAIAEARQATATARTEGQTATAGASQASEGQTATAVARQTVAVVAQRTAAAIAAATQTAAVPTATPAPQVLEPQPGTLAIADYQAQVQGLRRLLFETYDRGERTKAIWAQVDNETRRAVLRDNLYYLTMKVPDQIAWYYWNRDLGDTYNIELSVAFQTVGAPALVGIAFDVQPEAQSALFFEITNDRRWQFSTLVDGSFVTERSTGLIPDDVIISGNGTNTLWVVRKPDEIQLWINSKHVATTPPSPFTGGRAGACISSQLELSEPATVIVDNFLARAP